jgi:hypothetical protein
MSDETAPVDVPGCGHVSPTHATAMVGLVPGGSEQLDSLLDQELCPDPDCPARLSEELSGPPSPRRDDPVG